jgi:uncharacterized peroxidase-related enzyme
MSNIKLNNNLPGIVGLLVEFPETGKVLGSLAEEILRKDSDLPQFFREMTATYVSLLNECRFCAYSHAAVTAEYMGLDMNDVLSFLMNIHSEKISLEPKYAVLLTIASVVQANQEINVELLQEARDLGATDKDIHDVALIASAFCMYNRYVKSLGTKEDTEEGYKKTGAMLKKIGYPQ